MTETGMSTSAQAITPETLHTALTERLSATHAAVEDISGGCGTSFSAVVVSPAFAGKGSLARHRLVNGALRDEIRCIHAWSAKCYTVEEWERRKVEEMEGVPAGV
ncbi:MAG: hypothetical protein M1832_003497 [Thelocarpon impressellum]|nr:MAG: hypothetical protein M1832_003497 [Thelocarpon impressellum]